MRKTILFILVFAILLGCSFEKRYHMNGYHINSSFIRIDKKFHSKNKIPSTETKTEEISSLKSSTTLIDSSYSHLTYERNYVNLKDSEFINSRQREFIISKESNGLNLTGSLIYKSHKSTLNSKKYNNRNILKKELKSYSVKKLDILNNKTKDKRKNSFSWPYFWFITLSVIITSFILASPFVAVFLLAYLIGFLISLHFYWWIRWKSPKLTKSCLFQFFYWVIAPQTFLFIGALIAGLFSN